MGRSNTQRANKKEGVTKVRTVKDKFIDEIKSSVSPKNSVQKEFLDALKNYDVVAFSAPAGCGKSFLAMSEASDWLKKGVYDKITLTRAVIPMGRSLGMLPSTLQQKFEPYLMPLLEVLWNRYGKSYYENALGLGTIELLAPEYARGRSVSGVFIIDEAQSMMPDELYTMLTRMETGSKLILIGDPNQSDIKGLNGIDWLCSFVEKNPELEEHIKVIKTGSESIVRSGLCKKMVQAKEREGVKYD
ncbi:putative phosphate starvation protein [Pseudomonas phage vB_PsyM_KIL3b]|uniref:Putative phosphate starvation inducible protein n=5 Tax=Flaumdravirus TaxID=2560133 RepID=A0A142IEW0_9CAUD|nr:PhoH-like phosphate starvation-inducible [Pseudomonas phage vB_PsyM_KIL1]YP_009616718.1 PhoH-like phosphate starvation-inducible [Pseudomonas phage vB_PsyM_KIL4]AMR57604.1 putative phosphate starvation protein [Pseudomonas phage vB_PsyM_KIL3]AMR57932.1 putative phosphate starvation inducible protein [Pseudomonas phage vB_PsyM_KIL5]AMR58102.1 putative phosphate starvation protein [Pseudomonas phage vB_PsyM_KIL3b]AMR57284.1 putative phosphate starvation protein [Pseudomonas phage vB_PsyM_KIL1